MATINDLCFAYHRKYPIFRHFNWTVTAGERWSVIGPSGCGKTTLLYLVYGLLAPDAGTINLNSATKPKGRSSTGLILQDYGLLPWLTASENIALGLKIRKVDKTQADRTAHSWLSRLDIEHIASHYPAELSGGQRQRVAVARTLSLEPELLLMDEPFASLDALTREELQDLVITLGGSLSSTVVLVTHNIEEAVFLGKRILVLNQPPNTATRVIENPASGSSSYRLTAEFVEKCREVRAAIEKVSGDSVSNEMPGGKK